MILNWLYSPFFQVAVEKDGKNKSESVTYVKWLQHGLPKYLHDTQEKTLMSAQKRRMGTDV